MSQEQQQEKKQKIRTGMMDTSTLTKSIPCQTLLGTASIPSSGASVTCLIPNSLIG